MSSVSEAAQASDDPRDGATPVSGRLTQGGLRASYEQLEFVTNAMPAYLARCDREGRYLWVNRRYAERFGFAPEDVPGRTMQDVMGPEAFEALRPYIDRVLSGETVEYEDEVPYRGLGRRWKHATYTPTRDDRGRVDGWIAVVTDITRRRHLEDALRRSEERHRTLMDLLPVGVYICDAPSGRLSYYNQEAARLWGHEPRLGDPEVRFCGAWNVLAPDGGQLPSEACPGRRVLEGGPPVRNQELIVERPDGSRVAVLVSVDPMRDAAGHVTGAITVFRDVTDRKRAEEMVRRSERVYRAIGESIDYGIWVSDPDGRNVYASESFLRLVGMTQEECAGVGWLTALEPGEREAALADWLACCRTGTSWERELRLRGADGVVHHVLSRGVPIGDEGRTICWAGINLDISALKRAQEELEQIDRRKDEFLATLAHELRNPLAPIRSSVSVLDAAAFDEPDLRAARDVIRRQVGQLTLLIDDLLDVSRITRGKIVLRRQPTTVGDVIERALETSRPVIDAAGHAIEIELPVAPVWIDVDPTRMAQVLSNLLNNASKYTPSPGRLRLVARLRGPAVEIDVIDNGMGIPADTLVRIFDMFAQGDTSLDRAQGGLGIGLTISRRLAEMHGGTIRARSDGPGRGSVFTVSVPVIAAPRVLAGSDERRHAPAHSPGRPRRVLIIDDNRDAADSLALLLRLHGHDAHAAYDGPHGLALARESAPQAIFVDIGMPGMTGYEVVRELRNGPATRASRIVAMTGWGREEDLERSRQAGFDHHLVKPADPDQVLQLIHGVTEN